MLGILGAFLLGFLGTAVFFGVLILIGCVVQNGHQYDRRIASYRRSASYRITEDQAQPLTIAGSGHNPRR